MFVREQVANLARWKRSFSLFNRTLIEMLFCPGNKMAPCRTDWCLYSTQYHTKPVKQTHQSTRSLLHFAFGFYCASLWKTLKTNKFRVTVHYRLCLFHNYLHMALTTSAAHQVPRLYSEPCLALTLYCRVIWGTLQKTWWLLVVFEVDSVQLEHERRKDCSPWGCRAT